MPYPTSKQPALYRAFAVALLALCPVAESHADALTVRGELRPAIAAVTSCTGKIQHHQREGKNQAVHTRAILPIDQTFFGTAPGGSLFLSLSNGVGLGLGESTRIWIQNYLQTMINPLHEGLHYEGSVSNLRIQLESGELAVAFNHLTPMSTARIDLPLGHVVIHSGKVVFAAGPGPACSITVFQGTATYYHPETNEREFITDGSSISISSASAGRSQIQSDTPPHWQKLADATEHARLRVLYRYNPEGRMPLVEWILPEENFGNPSARPYHFDLK